MEINSQSAQGPRPVRRNGEEAAIDITRPNREGIQRSTDKYLEAARTVGSKNVRGESHRVDKKDALELSDEAQLLSRETDESREAESARDRERIAELRAQYAERTLNTPERVDRAAGRLLGAE